MNFDTPDSLTRDLAPKTFIYADDRQLLCRSFAVRTKPDGKKLVMLEVMEECFEIIEDEN